MQILMNEQEFGKILIHSFAKKPNPHRDRLSTLSPQPVIQ